MEFRPLLTVHQVPRAAKKVNLRENYLKRLEELIQFDTLRKAKPSLVVDALHGCGAGYLDRTLSDHGVTVQAMRTERDLPVRRDRPRRFRRKSRASAQGFVVDSKATAGLATDGDADRFGIVDRDGTWIQPNLILALVYDYLVETRKWKMPAARSVATTQMIDAVAKSHGQTVHQTPVGFKYIGQLIREDKNRSWRRKKSAGLTIRGHIPEKDGILACLLVAEMIAARGASIGEQVRAMYKKLGREFWAGSAKIFIFPTNKRQTQSSVWLLTLRHSPAGKSYPSTAPMAQKFVFDDGSSMLLRLSGTEPLLRMYVEAEKRCRFRKN